MGIRKFISLLLLVAFALQLSPAYAASYDNAGATLPTVVQDSGTKANGANRDVVPVTLRVNNVLSGELVFSRVTNVKNGATATVSMTSNGQLSIAGGGTSIVTRRAIVLTPPTGTQFVGLPTDGYTTTLSRSFSNGLDATARTVNVSLGAGTSDSVLPGGGSDTNGNLILAGVITENGPSAYFGSTVTKGSIVVYPVTFVTGGESNTSDISFSLTGFGLVADPAGDTALSGTLSAANFSPTGGSLNAALTSVSTSTVSVATAAAAPAGGKLEAAMLTNEPDSQANVVLASRLATGSSTVKIGPGLITSTGTSLTSLNVDTDAIIIRATERADSTTSTKTYHQTPFATSAFVPGQALTANGSTSIAVLNTALSNTTKYPNTANALITVTFKAVNPADGTDSDATLVVDAVNVSLFGQRAFNKVRDISGNQDATLANGGWLGAIALGTNGGAAETRFGPGVLYNGTSATAALVVKDATPAGYTDQTLKVGKLAASNTAEPLPNANAPTSINGTTAHGIFPGSLVTDISNGDDASAWNIVATANGSGSDPFSFSLNGASAFAAAVNNGVAIYTPGELTARLLNASANAWFTILGTEDNSDLSNGRDLTVGATNLSTVLPSKAPIVNITLANRNAANNAIAAANLTNKVLTILPFTNRYDSLRDALAIRPEMTVTLGTNSRTQGVKIVAVISGGNIGTSEEVVVANILAAGSLDADFTLQTVPVAGNMTSLMVENGTAAGNGRALIALSSITGASTTTDALSDLVGTLALDTTKPPLFCGGTAGSGKNGPNGVIFQPKGRAILVTEAAVDQFKAIDDLGTARIRVTLPTGWDLNAYNGSLADSQILGVIATGGSTFTSAPALARVQPRNVNTGSSSTDAAFIDIDVGTPGTTTQTVSRIIGLVFKPNALVAPAGTTNFDATVTIVDVGSTNTRGATIADDTILATLGTVSLADACSTFLSLSYCDDAVSSYQATGSFGTVASTRLEQAAAIANGANLSEFSSAPTSAIRLIANTTSAVALPDLCIEEGIADALPIGQGVDGVPDAFGVAAVTSNGTGKLHIASSFQGTNDVGLAVGSSPKVLVSDNTVTVSADPTGSTNHVSFTIAEGSTTGRDRPFQAKTLFRVSGLQVDDSPSGTVPPAQNLIAWFEADTGAGNYAVGNSVPLSARKDTVNGNALVGVTTASAEDVKMAANFLNGDIIDNSSSVSVAAIDVESTSTAANNDLSIFFGSSTNAPMISNAVVNQVDDSTYNVLNSDTVISVSVSDITGSTDKLVEVSGAAGSLEPGSTLTISSSGTGPSDSVFVPVLADGSFKGVIRAATSQTITVIQTPDSADTSVAPQIRSLDVEDANVDPAITAAVVEDIGLGTVSEKGKVPVVFEVTSTGKSGGLDFVPTASQLTLGGLPVTAVAGSTTKFIGLVDFSQSDALTVVCTVGDDVSTVDLTELDSAAATLGGAPALTSVKNNGAGFVILKGKRLRTGETFGFVLDDGTFQEVTLGAQTKAQKKKFIRKSSAAEDIPANAVYAVFSVEGRGVSTVEIE